MKALKNSIFFFLSVSLFLTVAPKVHSQGDLLIFPKRVTFEGTQERIQILNLHNKGKDTATFKISYVENRMTANGKFQPIEKPDTGQNFASPYLRYYPRSITLAPNETQVVKVQLIKTNELKQGEYRSHLYFRAITAPKALGERNDLYQEGWNVKLIPVYGISIANIIRIGSPAVTVELSGLHLEEYDNHISLLNMDFSRTGEASSYGDIKVFHVSVQGKQTLVGEIQGFAVYTPIGLRKAKIELKKTGEVDFSTGKLLVTYVSQNRQEVLAEASLDL